MHSIVSIVKINPDLISGGPASVEIGFFNQVGKLDMTLMLPGKLFPKDIGVGDRLMFIQEEKFNQLLTIEVVNRNG